MVDPRAVTEKKLGVFFFQRIGDESAQKVEVEEKDKRSPLVGDGANEGLLNKIDSQGKGGGPLKEKSASGARFFLTGSGNGVTKIPTQIVMLGPLPPSRPRALKKKGFIG